MPQVTNVPAAVTVIAVTDGGGDTAIWEFSADIDVITNVSGLTVDGSGGDSVAGFGGTQLQVQYNTPISVGLPFATLLGLIDITFIGGGSLANAAGLVS